VYPATARLVLHDGQPRPGRAGRARDPQVEQGVVGLPDRVRTLGLVAVQQVERLPVALGAVVGEGDQCRIQTGHQRVTQE